jgi:sigma-B regulation protein RsbU (phosphoserine phosphatase)
MRMPPTVETEPAASTTSTVPGSADGAAVGGTNDAAAAGTRRGRRRAALSYRAGLLLSMSLLVIATGLTVSLLSFRGARASSTALAYSVFQEVSDHAVTKTREFLLRAVPLSQSLRNLAPYGLAGTGEPEQLARQLSAVLEAYPGVSWISFGDEQGSFVGAYRTPGGQRRVNMSRIEGGKTKVREFDVVAGGAWRPFRTDEDSGYDPRKRDFYRRAREAGKVVWTPPYIFYDQQMPGVTCANPIYDPATGQLRGVLTVDFDLNTLSKFVQQLSVSAHSRLFIMTADRKLLGHPTQVIRVIPGQPAAGQLTTIEDIDDPLVRAFDAQLAPDDRALGPGGTDRARQFEFRHDGTDYFARATAFTIDGDLCWVVGAVAPQDDFLGAARRSNTIALVASLGALGVAVIVATVLARRVSGPITALVSFMQGVGAGDLRSRAELGGAREFGQLSDALNRMIDDLRDRTRMRGALAVATAVQQKLLPATPPTVPGLDAYGFSVYCDETGGDYYDFLVLDGKTEHPRLLVAVGDVMGHGIGSALDMAAARAILHSRSTGCGHLGEMLAHLNDLLAADMAGHRFVTMMLCLIDPRTGAACYASAGHDPALVYDPPTDTFTETGRGGLPLGIDEGTLYEEQPFGPVQPGQVIVLGTDGVWDTLNPAGEFFGKEGVQQSIRAAVAGGAAKASEIAAALRRDLEAFRGDRHQRDDVTVVVLRVTGNN